MPGDGCDQMYVHLQVVPSAPKVSFMLSVRCGDRL